MVSKFEAWHEAWRDPWEGLLYIPAFVLVLGQLIGWKAQSANKVLGRLAARTIEIGPVIVLGALFVVFGIDSEGHSRIPLEVFPLPIIVWGLLVWTGWKGQFADKVLGSLAARTIANAGKANNTHGDESGTTRRRP
jgi:hypothetical protein